MAAQQASAKPKLWVNLTPTQHRLPSTAAREESARAPTDVPRPSPKIRLVHKTPRIVASTKPTLWVNLTPTQHRFPSTAAREESARAPTDVPRPSPKIRLVHKTPRIVTHITNTPDSDSASGSNMELGERIQALPQELQDSILSFTDAFEIPAKVVLVTTTPDDDSLGYRKCYKLPVALQLNRKLREKFAREYYSTAVFECLTHNHYEFTITTSFEDSYWEITTAHYMALWLRSLTKSHKDMIKTLQVTELHIVLGYYKRNPQMLSSAAEGIALLLHEKGLAQVSVILAVLNFDDEDAEKLEKYDLNGALLPEGPGSDVATFRAEYGRVLGSGVL